MPDQTLEERIRQISLDRDNGDLLLEEVVQQIQSIISSEIRKEKIKVMDSVIELIKHKKYATDLFIEIEILYTKLKQEEDKG